jgi:hypothetical protein
MHITVAKNALFCAAEEKRATCERCLRTCRRKTARRLPEGASMVFDGSKKSFRDDASQHPIYAQLRKLRPLVGNESGRARRPDRSTATCAEIGRAWRQ